MYRHHIKQEEAVTLCFFYLNMKSELQVLNYIEK